MLDVEVTEEAGEGIVSCARHLLEHALPYDDRDDRFSETWEAEISEPDSGFLAALGRSETGHPIGLVAGSRWRDHLQLDALVSDNDRWPNSEVLDALLDALAPMIDDAPSVELWGKPAHPWHDEVASRRGFEPVRALHQMRCALPVSSPSIETRPFVPGQDDEALRHVNNRAFLGHPDQGDISPDDLADRLAEPWNDPDGIRLHEVDGEIVGFCWTKIHPEQGLGEIYAIGLDPSVHGQGLGVPMTVSGLDWLHGKGLETGMLYVEADNVPAIRTYERIGFRIARTDRAWRRSESGSSK